MGIINQGILGGFSGKVGPIVGCHWKSKYYIRAHAAKVSNPRTKKQQEQRGKFATAFSFLKLIKPFIRIGFKGFAEKKSAFNAAMSYMLKRAVVGDGNEITIDFNRVLISTGSLMPVFESKATVSDNKMIFNWKDNSGMGNAEGTDIAMVLVYNKDKEEAVYDTEVGFRRNESSQLALPTNWQDDELVAYLSFRSADGYSVANSVRVSISRIEVSENEAETQYTPAKRTSKSPLSIRRMEPQFHIKVCLSSNLPYDKEAWKFEPPIWDDIFHRIT